MNVFSRSVARELRAGQVLELERLTADRIEHRDVGAGAARTRLVQDHGRADPALGQEVHDRKRVAGRVEQVVLGVVVVRVVGLPLRGGGTCRRQGQQHHGRETG